MSQVVDENSNPNISISKEIDQNIKPASNVFGSILDGDDGNSLCYSPSPVFGRKKSKRFTFEEDKDEIQHVQVKDNPITEDTKPIQTKNEKPRRARSPLRSRSPIRQDLLDKAQAAIDSANVSVNSALNKVRKAKEEADSEKKREIAKLREERKQEKERAMTLQAEAEKKKRELLNLKREAISKHSKTKVERQRLQNKAKMSVVEEEIQFKSSVYRAHKKKQKEEENRRKRISMAVRADIRKNNRDGLERLRIARIQEDNIHFEERHGSSVAAEKFKKDEADRRRISLFHRNGIASRNRQVHAEMKQQKLDEEHESYELKWAGEKDAEEYRKQMAEERRASLAFRHQEGKRLRDVDVELQSQRLEEEHKSYELKWAGEKDAEEYGKQMVEERRMSYAFRNEEGKRQRELEAEQHSDKLADEHESYELKWAGEKDAEAHRRRMAEERRASLEFRHLEGKRQRELEAEQHSDKLADEHESYELKWAGEKDVERYRAEEEQKKRESLQLRNHEGKIHREIDAQIQSDMIEERAQDERLQAACRRDVENYRRECAERDRASLMFRRGEAKIQRMEENMRQLQELELEEVNRELDALAREDVKLYVKECKERRRMSLAVRAAEKKRHRKWEKEYAEIVRQERSRDTQDRALDSQYVQLAKDNERAAIALDALRHHDCSFSSNPFASLLG